SRRRHTRWPRDWSSDVCSSDLDDVERHPTGLRLAQPSGLMFFLRLEGQDEVGVVNILNQNTWHAAALDRLFEPVAVHRIREDTYCLAFRAPQGPLPSLICLVLQFHRLGPGCRLAHLKPTVRRAHPQFRMQRLAP